MEKLALKSVGTSSLYGHPTDGKVINIPLSFNESKAVKFLKDAVKKTLKKTVLKAARKGKAPSEEVVGKIDVCITYKTYAVEK